MNDPVRLRNVLSGAEQLADPDIKAWSLMLRRVIEQVERMFWAWDKEDQFYEQECRRLQAGVLQQLPALAQIKTYEDRIRRSISKGLDRLQAAQDRRARNSLGSFGKNEIPS
jgi:hypothetical protein